MILLQMTGLPQTHYSGTNMYPTTFFRPEHTKDNPLQHHFTSPSIQHPLTHTTAVTRSMAEPPLSHAFSTRSVSQSRPRPSNSVLSTSGEGYSEALSGDVDEPRSSDSYLHDVHHLEPSSFEHSVQNDRSNIRKDPNSTSSAGHSSSYDQSSKFVPISQLSRIDSFVKPKAGALSTERSKYILPENVYSFDSGEESVFLNSSRLDVRNVRKRKLKSKTRETRNTIEATPPKTRSKKTKNTIEATTPEANSKKTKNTIKARPTTTPRPPLAKKSKVRTTLSGVKRGKNQGYNSERSVLECPGFSSDWSSSSDVEGKPKKKKKKKSAPVAKATVKEDEEYPIVSSSKTTLISPSSRATSNESSGNTKKRANKSKTTLISTSSWTTSDEPSGTTKKRANKSKTRSSSVSSSGKIKDRGGSLVSRSTEPVSLPQNKVSAESAHNPMQMNSESICVHETPDNSCYTKHLSSPHPSKGDSGFLSDHKDDKTDHSVTTPVDKTTDDQLVVIHPSPTERLPPPIPFTQHNKATTITTEPLDSDVTHIDESQELFHTPLIENEDSLTVDGANYRCSSPEIPIQGVTGSVAKEGKRSMKPRSSLTEYAPQSNQVACTSDDVVSETQCDDVIPKTQSDDVIPKTQSDDVIPKTQSDDVIPKTQSDDVIPKTPRKNLKSLIVGIPLACVKPAQYNLNNHDTSHDYSDMHNPSNIPRLSAQPDPTPSSVVISSTDTESSSPSKKPERKQKIIQKLKSFKKKKSGTVSTASDGPDESCLASPSKVECSRQRRQYRLSHLSASTPARLLRKQHKPTVVTSRKVNSPQKRVSVRESVAKNKNPVVSKTPPPPEAQTDPPDAISGDSGLQFAVDLMKDGSLANDLAQTLAEGLDKKEDVQKNTTTRQPVSDIAVCNLDPATSPTVINSATHLPDGCKSNSSVGKQRNRQSCSESSSSCSESEGEGVLKSVVITPRAVTSQSHSDPQINSHHTTQLGQEHSFSDSSSNSDIEREPKHTLSNRASTVKLNNKRSAHSPKKETSSLSEVRNSFINLTEGIESESGKIIPHRIPGESDSVRHKESETILNHSVPSSNSSSDWDSSDIEADGVASKLGGGGKMVSLSDKDKQPLMKRNLKRPRVLTSSDSSSDEDVVDARNNVIDTRKDVIDTRNDVVDARKDVIDARVVDARKDVIDPRKDVVDARKSSRSSQKSNSNSNQSLVTTNGLPSSKGIGTSRKTPSRFLFTTRAKATTTTCGKNASVNRISSVSLKEKQKQWSNGSSASDSSSGTCMCVFVVL